MKKRLLSCALLIIAFTLNGQEVMLPFNGVSLENWEIIDYEGHGNIYVADSSIIIEKGEVISGIRWTKDFPRTNYEVSYYARRIDGNDFFCAITVPVKDSFLTLVLGGWGGSLCGLSCIDGFDAANNSTGTIFRFASGWWYAIRLRVTDKKIEAWVEDEKLVDFPVNNTEFSLRWEVESSAPFGFTTYKTTGAIRNIKVVKTTE